MQLSSGKQIWATAWQKQQNDVRPGKTQISLDIRPVWSESSLHGETLDPKILSYPVSVQLIWVFARSHAGHFIGFVMLWFIYIFQF